MRVVNSIEKEMMQAEWETWIQEETSKCEQMRHMLDAVVNSPNAPDAGGLDVVRARLSDYCFSCREAGRVVLEG